MKPEPLLDVLLEARALVARPETDFTWSSWRDAAHALGELDDLLILPRSEAAAAPFEEAIRSSDARALFDLDLELTPFYCPSCDAVYCCDHWDWWDVWDDEWPGWRDSVRGRCPQGHERSLED